MTRDRLRINSEVDYSTSSKRWSKRGWASCTLMRLACGYAGRAALFQRNMIHMRCRDGHVFARSHAGKHSEIVDEVRLVVVAAPVGQVGPVLAGLLRLR